MNDPRTPTSSERSLEYRARTELNGTLAPARTGTFFGESREQLIQRKTDHMTILMRHVSDLNQLKHDLSVYMNNTGALPAQGSDLEKILRKIDSQLPDEKKADFMHELKEAIELALTCRPSMP
jgi:hypothetical protein